MVNLQIKSRIALSFVESYGCDKVSTNHKEWEIGESSQCDIMFLMFSPKSVPLGVVARPSLLL